METCDHGLEHQADVRPSPPTVRWKQSFSRAIGRAEVENSPRGDGWDGLNHTPLSIALVSAIHAPHRQPDKTRVRQAASGGDEVALPNWITRPAAGRWPWYRWNGVWRPMPLRQILRPVPRSEGYRDEQNDGGHDREACG